LIQQEGSNLRYLEIYLTQLKKRLDMKELSKIQGTRIQGPSFVTLENIVANNKPLRDLLGPNLHSLFSSLH
jgi:hypothetical protein